MASKVQVPKLTHVFNLRAYLSKEIAPAGNYRGGAQRYCSPVSGGYMKGVEGSRAAGLSVELMPGGSDWIVIDEAAGMAHVDVRTQGTTEAGHGFFIHYTGYIGIDPATAAIFTRSPDRKTTQDGDHHWWTNPTFETNSTFVEARKIRSNLHANRGIRRGTSLDDDYAFYWSRALVGWSRRHTRSRVRDLRGVPVIEFRRWTYQSSVCILHQPYPSIFPCMCVIFPWRA